MDRNEFKEKAKKKIDELFAKIDELFVKMDKLELKEEKVKFGAKGKYEEFAADVKSMKDELQSRYQDLVDASEDNWMESAEAFNSSLKSFREAFAKLTSVFS